MRISIIGDRMTVLGFQLAGIKESTVPANVEEAREALERYNATPDMGIILIAEAQAEGLSKEIESIRLDKAVYPIIVEIPDTEGPRPTRPDPIKMRIKRAVGIDTSGGTGDGQE